MTDHISWGSERMCDDCGLPVWVCNARAMINMAMERGHSLESIVPQVGLLQAKVEGLTKERDFENGSRLTSEAQLGVEIDRLMRERDAALAREGAVAMEVRGRCAKMADPSPVNAHGSMVLAARIRAMPIPTDAAAALARRDDEMIERVAAYMDHHGIGHVQDRDRIRALKRSGKE